MKLITLTRLNRAVYDVQSELTRLGIWNEMLYSVDVYLTPLHYAYGWKMDGARGYIGIPAVSLSRLPYELFGIGQRWGLRDVLRHEYAHAYADLYPKLSRSREFVRVFGGSYDRSRRVRTFDPDQHVTEYASTTPAEDFAEVFMFFVKHRGRLRGSLDTSAIRRKWRFIGRFIKRIRQGHTTF